MSNCDNNELRESSVIGRGWLALIIGLVVVVADQVLKIWVKTNFYLGEDYEIFPWFHLKFIENNGMAFGLELWNKILLTVGRIVAVGAFVWFILKIKDYKDIRLGFLVAVALISAGALGNIFDCVFYGRIFNNPMPPEIATIFPAEGGYAPWLEGKVVDMLFFPLASFYWPEWIPGIGGSYYEFFAYIFNIADSSICIGVFMIILFYSKDASIAFRKIGADKTAKDKLK